MGALKKIRNLKAKSTVVETKTNDVKRDKQRNKNQREVMVEKAKLKNL